MAKRRTAETAALRFDVLDRPEAITAVADRVASIKGRIRALTTVRRLDGEPPLVEIELEVEGVSESDLVAALDTELDDGLRNEGLARELVNKVQNLRKTAGLDIAQRIEVQICAEEGIGLAVDLHREYIAAEVLATRID